MDAMITKLLLVLAITALVMIPFAVWLGYLILPPKVWIIQTDVKFTAPFIAGIFRYRLYAKVTTWEYEKRNKLQINERTEEFKVRKSDCLQPLPFFLDRIGTLVQQERGAILEQWNQQSDLETQLSGKPRRLRIDRSYRRQLHLQLKHPEEEEIVVT